MKTTGTPWPNILADLEAKRGAIDTLIGLVREHFVGDDPTAMPESPAPSNGKATRAEKRGRTDGRSKARASATRSLPDGAHAQAIVAALTKHGPTSPGDLARALKWDISVLRYRMKPLLQSKTVLATGATINRVLSLPGHRAKEAP
jgi:hypothetical protein